MDVLYPAERMAVVELVERASRIREQNENEIVWNLLVDCGTNESNDFENGLKSGIAKSLKIVENQVINAWHDVR